MGLYTGTLSDDEITGDFVEVTVIGLNPDFSPILDINEDYLDFMYGFEGNDTLNGGYGSDQIFGGTGNDVIYGFGSSTWPDGTNTFIVDDVLVFSNQGSHLADDDLLYGGEGNDTIYGGNGNDTIEGDIGTNVLLGGDGNDTLTSFGSTSDIMDGEAGDDRFIVVFADAPSLQGGSGIDTLNITGGTISNFSAANGFERVGASLGDNYFFGTAQADVLDFSSLTLTERGDTLGFQIYAQEGDDAITGTSFDDVLAGAGGNDTLIGGDGNDIISGGDGDDHIEGGSGDDILAGDAGTNVILGGDGNDSLTAFLSIFDVLDGGAGDDHVSVFTVVGVTLQGGSGIDTLTATSVFLSGFSAVNGFERIGNDNTSTIIGTEGSNVLDFSSLTLTERVDTFGFEIYGELGDDTITGTAFDDTIFGGDGDDTLSGSAGNDRIDGGLGFDVVNFTGNVADYSVISLGPDVWQVTDNRVGAPDGENVISSVENLLFNGVPFSPLADVVGTTGPDVLIGDDARNRISGEGGDDYIDGAGDNDIITGGSGNDTLIGGEGSDTFRVGLNAGTDSVSGGDGYDRIEATAANAVIGLSEISGIDLIDAAGFAGVRVVGSSAAQTLDFSLVQLIDVVSINGDGGNDVIIGSLGADTIIGSFGSDTMDGGGGDDTFQIGVSAGLDTIEGGDGHDRIVATAANAAIGLVQVSGIEEISAGGFAGVRIVGSSASQVLDFSEVTLTGITSIDAANGNDTVIGSAGDDNLLGGFGNDTLDGGAGKNTLTGGGGNDVFVVRTANDKVVEVVDGGIDRIDVQMNTFSIAPLAQIENVTFTGIGNATLTGNALANIITGGAGNDTLNAGNGNDTVNGLGGDDTITGSFGNDALDGGDGDDSFLFGTSAGIDIVIGGAGYDRIAATANNAVFNLSQFSGIEAFDAAGFTGVRLVTTASAQVLDFSGVTFTGSVSIDGDSGNDTIIGSAGNDTIIGNFGNDVLDGGDGDDTFLIGVSAGFDTINGGTGFDRIMATANNAVISLTAISGIERIDGAGFSGVRVLGTASAQTMDFSAMTLAGSVTIDGNRGNDTIIGSAGNDTIIGGSGKDTLTGGGGADRFVFATTTDSSRTSSDTITDFLAGTDGINLSAIDADGAAGAQDAFAWLGTGAFTGSAGQLRYEQVGGNTLVYGDTNGDSVADLQITLTGLIGLGAANFLL